MKNRTGLLLALLPLGFVLTNNSAIALVYQGLTNTSLGAATLAVSGSVSGSQSMIVSNLGSSGQDGVAIAMPGSLSGLDVGWLDLDPSNALPVGAYVRSQIIGTAGAVTNGVWGTVTVTKAGTAKYQVAADYSSIGASTYTVQAYLNGALVGQATKQSGASLAVAGANVTTWDWELWPNFGPTTDWNQPTTVLLGGATVTCDRLYIIPENVPITNAPTVMQITASQVPVITVTSENASLVYQGLTNTSLGNATLALSGGQSLIVSNLGSSGQDGVNIALNPGNTVEVQWDDLDPSNALPVGAYVQEQIIGTAGAVTNRVLGTLRSIKMGTGNSVMGADFSPLGASNYLVQVWNGPNLVTQQTGQTGTGISSFFHINWSVSAGCCPWYVDGDLDGVSGTITVGSVAYIGNKVVVIPQGGAVDGSLFATQIRAASIPSITITNEQVSVTYAGLTHTALGNATLAVSGSGSSSQSLIVSNLGSSGQDGVNIALNPGNNIEVHWQNLDPNNALPVGAYVQEQIIGTAGAVTNGVLGTVQCTKAGTSNYVTTADFSPLGSSNRTVQIYNGPNLVEQVTGQTGPGVLTCSLINWSASVGCCPPYVDGDIDDMTGTITAYSTATPVMGNHWLIYPEGVTGDSSVFAAQIRAASIPSITIIKEDVSVTFAGLTHTALGDATLAIACCVSNLGSSGQDGLTISNLGSSGQDGVNIALNGANSFDGEWLDLDPSNALPVGAYVRSQIIGTAGAVTNGVLGSTQITKAGTSNYVMSADFTPLGSPTRTVQVYNGTNLVAQVTGQSGPVVANCIVITASVSWECCPFKWDWDFGVAVNMAISGQPPVVGDRVLLIPEGAAAASSLSAGQILAANIPSITITNESVSFVPQLRINSIARSGNDILLAWTTEGINNIVQFTTNTTGNYNTNSFVDLADFVITTPTTNYVDVGGATNKPARYYRIREPLP